MCVCVVMNTIQMCYREGGSDKWQIVEVRECGERVCGGGERSGGGGGNQMSSSMCVCVIFVFFYNLKYNRHICVTNTPVLKTDNDCFKKSQCDNIFLADIVNVTH